MASSLLSRASGGMCRVVRPASVAAAPCRRHAGLPFLAAAPGSRRQKSSAVIPGVSTPWSYSAAPSMLQKARPPPQEVQKDSFQEEREAQQQFANESSSGLSVLYVRCGARKKIWRWLRGVSIDLNYDFNMWREHQKATRHLALWTPAGTLCADNIRRLLFPDLAVMGAISSSICYYNSFFGMMTLPLECFSLTTVAMGLLVTFKTRSCYERFDDARGQWGLITNESRAIASRILARVPANAGKHIDEVQRARLHALKYVQTFPHLLKYHLTEDGCNPHIMIGKDMSDAEVRAAISLSLEVELSQIWDMNDKREAGIVHRILALQGNRPLFVLHELGHINSKIFADPAKGALHPIISSELDRSVTLFQHVLGRCERIFRTPVYSPYVKLTSRFLYCWCAALPLGMYPLLGPMLTPPVTLVVSFFMLGIQDLGNRVEQPFDMLPLWQYCSTVDASVQQLMKQAKTLEGKQG